MEYLYGDSSAAKLDVNYIDLLRDALDFAVEVLLAGQRVRKWKESGRERRSSADAELQRLADLENNLLRVLDGLVSGNKGTPTARCAERIARSVESSVRAEESAVKSALADDLARIDGELTRERGSLIRVLETLLLRHDLPETTRRLHLEMVGGNHYTAHLIETALHLDSVLELDIPADHLFGNVVRVERLMDNLEIRAPDKRGWLHKKVKFVPFKLAREYIVEVEHSGDETLIRLRSTPDFQDSGFDIVVLEEKEGPEVKVTRVHKESDQPAQKFEPDSRDLEPLLDLQNLLVKELAQLGASRRNLVDAKLDGLPLEKHEHPAILVERLVSSMSPVVREIASHSLIPGELVLKRLLSDDRREEIFVSKSELETKVRRLPTAMQKLFEPLGLGQNGAPPPPSAVASDFPVDDDEDAITKVSTPSGELPLHAGTDAAETVDGAEPVRRRKDSSAAIELGSQDAIPIEPSDGIPLDSGEAIAIDEDWLEEASEVKPAESKPAEAEKKDKEKEEKEKEREDKPSDDQATKADKPPESKKGKKAPRHSSVKASEVPPEAAPEPVEKTLSSAIRELDEVGAKTPKPKKIR